VGANNFNPVGSRKFNIPTLQLKQSSMVQGQNRSLGEENNSDVEVQALANSDDDNQSYMSLKVIGGADYSDVESSGNVIRISSKRSESDITGLLSVNDSESDVHIIDGTSSYGGSQVSGTQVMRLDSRRVGNAIRKMQSKQQSNVQIIDDYQSQGYGIDSEMDA